MKKSNNVLLIGFMGVGKGTVSRELAKSLNMLLLDTDDLIEVAQNRKIREIFAQEGEEYFRDLERKTAKNLAANVKNSIIACGGGFAKIKNLKQIGKVVYLKSSFEGIITRLENSENSQKKFAKRPLLADLDKAKRLFEERKKLYKSRAYLIVEVDGKTPEQIAKDVKTDLKLMRRNR